MGGTSVGKRLYCNLRGFTIIFTSDGTTQAANTAHSLWGKSYLILDINVFIFMCICLYLSNINFFYSNFLSFASLPVPHHSGARLALHKHCLWGGTEQHHPREETVCAKGPVLILLLPVTEQLDWTGGTLSVHMPASQCCKALGRGFHVQPLMWMVPCAPEPARLNCPAMGVEAHPGMNRDMSYSNLIQMRANLGAHLDPRPWSHRGAGQAQTLDVTQTTSDY